MIFALLFTRWMRLVWYRGREVPGCFFCVLHKRSISKAAAHGKDIIQCVIGTDEQQIPGTQDITLNW